MWPAIVVVVAGLQSPQQERVKVLAEAVVEVSPRRITMAEALVHAAAAVAAERPGIDAALLLGVAATESHFTARVRSKGGRYCGPLQATRDKDGWSCRDLQTPWIGYRAGALSIARWMKVCRGRVTCSLHGYGGTSVNKSFSYPRRVLRRAKAIRAYVKRRSR